MSETPAEETEGEFAGYDPGDEQDPEQLEGFYGAPVAAGSTPLEQLLEGLNPDQRRAVEHGEGPLLVLAGAGSGKTRVLVHRIAYLLQTGMARPGQILAITFTNKAANEMKSRVEALTGNAARVMWVMTFHSACARILRQHAERLGYKRGFSIFDEADSRRMVKRCMDELDVDPKRYPPRTIKGAISGAKNRLRDSETYREEAGSYFETVVADVYALYEKQMHDNNAMDFDDLLVRTVNLLELFADVRAGYQRQFRHVLVDEYQDTNRVQYRLLQLLTEDSGNLFVVGDDAQCLVDLRLPCRRDPQHPRLRAGLRRREGQARAELPLDADDPRRLERGDRPQPRPAPQGAVDRCGRRRAGDDRRAPRRARGGALGRGRDRPAGRGGRHRRDEVAVFYRMNAQSRVLEDTLVRFDVPYQVIGGTKFYERAEIQDAVAYLTLLVNPEDSVSLAGSSTRRGGGSAGPRRRGCSGMRTRSASRRSR